MCWGGNADGRIGDATSDDRLVPALVAGLTDAVQLEADSEHTCARRRSGEWVCWGQLRPLGEAVVQRAPVRVRRLDDAVEVEAGNLQACLRRATGAVECWGRWSSRIEDAEELTVGGGHVCARRQGGVYCAGINGHGQLGDGTTHDRLSDPAPVVGVTSATAITAGSDFTCALLEEGSVTCWGQNALGQCGSRGEERHTLPTGATVLDAHRAR